jgi:hypothetical protein
MQRRMSHAEVEALLHAPPPPQRLALEEQLAVAERPREPSTPCEGCRHQPRCRAQKLACEAFRLHVNAGRYSAVAPRQPSAAIFLSLFGES